MNVDFLLFLILNVALIGALAFIILRQLQKLKKPDQQEEEQQRQQLKNLVNEVFGEVTQKVGEQSREILKGEQKLIETDLKNKQEQIEKVVGELRRELNQRQDEIRKLEDERGKQFSEISTHIREHQNITKELQSSTEKLSKVLSNNQKRGEWGEHILDDILQTAGLIEGVHYVRQQPLGKTTVKPDISLLLPNKRVVAVDVKFPYSAIQKMADTESKVEKESYRKEFVTDVKNKVHQLEERGYINLEEGTLDYAIIFVPNEMLFSYINQECPEVIDIAMRKRIMIVSPFTFLIVARTIIESYRNFMIENNLRDIIKFISEFVEEWERFEGEFGKFDDQLGKLRQVYDKIATTRYSRMRLRIGRIEEYRQGMLETATVKTLPEETGAE
jgi:DNA recombination protein RmuC